MDGNMWWAVAVGAFLVALLIVGLYLVTRRGSGRLDEQAAPGLGGPEAPPEPQAPEASPDPEPESAAGPGEAPADVAPVGVVRGVLRPRGLVEVGGLIEPGWWHGDGPAPPRDSSVRVTRSTDGAGWIVESPLGREDRSAGAVTAAGVEHQ